jgi:hypothetical protein
MPSHMKNISLKLASYYCMVTIREINIINFSKSSKLVDVKFRERIFWIKTREAN